MANWADGWAKLSGPKAEVRKEKGNLFLFNFSKAIQNAIPTKFKIRLETRQYKIICRCTFMVVDLIFGFIFNKIIIS